MIWKDRKYINPRKRVFKNMDTNEILNLEIQDDLDNIEEESETPLNAHNLNLSQQELLDDMSKTYTGTNITAPTVEGYGTINKVWGHTIEEGTGEKSPTNPYTLRCVGDDENLFDKSTVTVNKYLNNEGTLISVGTWSTSDYIPCQPQTQYIESGYTDLGTAPCRCYYDKNKNRISSVQHNQNTENMKFTTPSNCYYFQESVHRADLDTFKIQKGSIVTPYSPYGKGTVEIISQNGDEKSSNTVVTKPLCSLKDGDNIIAQDYIDYTKGVVHRECGYISSYNNETISIQYISSTGSLTEGAIIVYKLDQPIEEPLKCSNKIEQYSTQTTVSNPDGAKIKVRLTNNEAISGVNGELGALRNDVNKMRNYSTEEQKIGTWIDGKELYRKVFKVTSDERLAFEDILSQNIDMAILCGGYVKGGGGSKNSIELGGFYRISVNIGGTMKFVSTAEGNTKIVEYSVIVIYTKTTD